MVVQVAETVQLGHEEFLLLLGILRLPMPEWRARQPAGSWIYQPAASRVG
jgi:hypothetical protein